MIPKELEILQNNRSELWRLACQGRITVEELYRELGDLRRRAGPALYPQRSIQPKYPQR